MKELLEIQSKLKAPKDKYNDFGKYKYRSAESILESVKPILKDLGCTLTLSDEIENIGNRYYVKATVTLVTKDGAYVSTTAYAREDESKKGMDGSQITGTASSYARKYALNGLFAIDDTKDADTNEFHNENEGRANARRQSQQNQQTPMRNSNDQISATEAATIKSMLQESGVDVKDFLTYIGNQTHTKVASADAMSVQQFALASNELHRIISEKRAGA